MNSSCPKLEKCHIYSGILKDKVMTGKAYRHYFCESDDFIKCKRYLVSQEIGKCPPGLLPNSHKTVDEIIQEFNKTQS